MGIGTPEQQENYNPNLAWVSSNPDISSPEWQNAVKVRQVLSIAIDRQLIVDTLLHGFGRPLPLRDWAGFEQRMPAEWQWEYNPDRVAAGQPAAGLGTVVAIPMASGCPDI